LASGRFRETVLIAPKELVLEIGPPAVEFIHKDDFSIPDRRLGGDVAQRTLGFVGDRDADQVVVVDERSGGAKSCNPKKGANAI
jgi:hypothetical protein